MPDESQALARFYDGWVEDGVGEDGLPRYRERLMIRLAVPPYTQLDREVEPGDYETYPLHFAAYEKEKRAKSAEASSEGYPLALWPVVRAHQLQMLVARDIVTVEQLAKHAGRGVSLSMPPELKILAERAAQMIEMSKSLGQFEVQLRDRDGQLDALKEQVEELKQMVAARDAEIASLRLRTAA